ncbi:MAG: hypothetical protein GX879_03240, partial [Bacteroidales bacterium]|nr:hypothetical protein [Bacteroidales bacterium]
MKTTPFKPTKHKHLIISLLCLFLSLNSIAQWQGSGSEEDPYQIHTKADILAMTEAINSSGASYLEGIHFALMDDIEEALTAKIGANFKGYLHGRGHYMNLELHDENNYYNNVLFYSFSGYMDSITFNGNVSNFWSLMTDNFGVLKYLTINLNIQGVYEDTENNGEYVFQCSIFTINNYGIISHCINNSDINVLTPCKVAQISAFSFQNGDNMIIESCINNGNITVNCQPNAIIWIGIFISFGGLLNDKIINSVNNGNIIINGIPETLKLSCFAYGSFGEISNCINTGTIQAKGTDIFGTFSCESLGTISNCLNTGTIIGENIASAFAGKVYAHNTPDASKSEIKNCLNIGYVSGNNKVGALFGEFNNNESNPNRTATIKNNISLSKTSGYVLFGDTNEDVFSNPSLILENNFYDKQMVPQQSTAIGDIPGKAEGLLTTDMTGFALQEILGDGWSYAEGRYPIPLGLENDSVVIAAVTPIFLHAENENNYEHVDSVSKNFYVTT